MCFKTKLNVDGLGFNQLAQGKICSRRVYSNFWSRILWYFAPREDPIRMLLIITTRMKIYQLNVKSTFLNW